MKPPFSWYGGKIRMAKQIVDLLPRSHTIYVEGFGGSGAVLFAKEPAPVEIYNDIDHGLVHFYRTLRNPETSADLIKFISLIPFSREEFDWGAQNWSTQSDDVAKAAYWFIVARQSFAGRFAVGWSRSGKAKNNHALSFMNAVDRLPEIHERLRGVQIENRSYEYLINAHDSPDTVFYFDPPYMHETRSANATQAYQHEMFDDEHNVFIARMLSIRGKVVISGYQSPLYDTLLTHENWRRIDTDVYTSASLTPANKRRTECLWLNY